LAKSLTGVASWFRHARDHPARQSVVIDKVVTMSRQATHHSLGGSPVFQVKMLTDSASKTRLDVPGRDQFCSSATSRVTVPARSHTAT